MNKELVTLLDLEPSRLEFQNAVSEGLSQNPKTLPCKFFYDTEGSQLFDRICALPEYYPTRIEYALLSRHARNVAALAGAGATLVEFGSGAGIKVRLLLSAMQSSACYVPIDISRDHLIHAAASLADEFPRLVVSPVCADYTNLEVLPPDVALRGEGRMVGFFPGSTIGNFSRQEAIVFLRQAKRMLGPASLMIVGVDVPKSSSILTRAYDDDAGVTAAFNLNLLARINRELDGDFDLSAFRHRAIWNESESRIEMHLVSTKEQYARMAEHRFTFKEGETIHTENSYKYAVDDFKRLATYAGYHPRSVWLDAEGLFSIHALEAPS